MVWLGLDGSEAPIDVKPSSYYQVALSPDGRRAVVGDSAPPNTTLRVVDLERKSISNLTFEGTASDPVWSPDGTRIAYASSPDGKRLPKLVWRRADGSTAAETLLDVQTSLPMSFSPDGKLLAFERREASQSLGRIWLLPMDGSGKAHPFAANEATSIDGAISPDGRWIAYTSFESGAFEVYLRPFPTGDGKWQVSTGGGGEPHWSRDGRAVYFRSAGSIFRVDVDLFAGVRLGEPQRLGPSIFGGTVGKTFDVADDGRVLTYRFTQDAESARQIDLDTGWGRKVEALLAGKR